MFHTHWFIALNIAIVAYAAVPRSASACSLDPCQEGGMFTSVAVATTEVTTEGVIALPFARASGGDSVEEALQLLTVTVTETGGTEVPGSLEVDGGEYGNSRGAYLWRPTDALTPGTALVVEIAVDLPASVEDRNSCTIEVPAAQVVVVEEPLPDLSLPPFSVEEDYVFEASADLNDLVCCDGSFPAEHIDTCGVVDVSIGDEGYCVAKSGVGYARGTFVLDEPLSASVAAAVRFDYWMDGERVASRLATDAPPDLQISMLNAGAFEAEIHMVSLIDGTTWESEATVVDGGRPDALGSHEPDVRPELAEHCDETPYTCGTVSEEDAYGYGMQLEAWDPGDCTPFNEDTSGDGTESGTSEDGGTTGADTTGSDTTMGGEATSSGASTTSATGDTASSSATSTSGGTTTSADDSSGATSENEGDGAGCDCSAGATPPPLLAAVGVLLMGVLRRRRR